MKKIFSIEHAIHGVIILCACTSLENIHDFFKLKGHLDSAAWLISLTLGSGVVTTSIMLTKIDQKAAPYAFRWMVISAMSFALLSGGIQSAQYAEHQVEMPWNLLLGFSLPIAGEVLLAWASSLYILHQRTMILQTIQIDAQSAVTTALVESLQRFDPNAIEERVNQLLLQLADQSLTAARMSLIDSSLPSTPAQAFTESLNQPAVLEPEKPPNPPAVLGPEKVDAPTIDLVDAIDRVEKITPGVHCLVTKKNGDVYLVDSIDGDVINLSFRSQPSYKREVKMSSISRYYDVKKLTDL